MKEALTSEQDTSSLKHEFDEDACCVRCGFDGAEWWHLEKHKPKEEREPEPECRPRG